MDNRFNTTNYIAYSLEKSDSMKWLIVILILATVLIAGCTGSISNLSSKDNSNCPVEIKDILKNCISNVTKTTGHFDSTGVFLYNREEAIKSCNKSIAEIKNYNIPFEQTSFDKEERCNKGTETGQNVNYIYCGFIPLMPISKLVISPEGVIQERASYEVNSMTLNSTYDVIDIKC